MFPEILGPAPLQSTAFSSPCVSPRAGKGSSHFSQAKSLSRVWERLPCSKMQLDGWKGPICPELHSCLQSRGSSALGVSPADPNPLDIIH